MSTYWGIDLGGTWLRLAYETEAGACGASEPGAPEARPGASPHPAESRRLAEPRPTPMDYPGLLAAIADAAAAIQAPPPDRIGMSIPGTSSQGVPAFVPALPWLEGKPLAADLASLNGARTELALDGHLTLLAEATEGVAREARDALLLTAGTGIGGAVMIDRRIWRGRTGACGSWGWMPASEPSPNPRHGDLEYAASGAALRRRASALGREVAELVTATDDDARTACAEIGRHLGAAIGALARMLDPELIVLSGGMTTWHDTIGQAVRTELAQRLPDPALVVPGQLGKDAALLGAITLARRGKVWL